MEVNASHWPPSAKQRLVKDMKVLEILTDILYYSFKNNLCKFDDGGENLNPEIFKIL